MENPIVRAYANRSAEYAERFASLSATHPSDRALVAAWARGLHGEVVDAGCGPGQWTAFLHDAAADASLVRGLDPVPEFIDLARAAHPELGFRVGAVEELVLAPGTLGGVLAWYSLIHHQPSELPQALDALFAGLRPGGQLLAGFFDHPGGTEPERFDHAVIAAYRWPAKAFAERLEAAGFLIAETHSRTSGESRPHAAIWAHKPGG